MFNDINLNLNQNQMKFNEKHEQIQREGDIKKLTENLTDTINKLLHSKSELVSFQLAYDNVYKLAKHHKQNEVLELMDQKLSNFVNSVLEQKQSLTLKHICEALVQIKSISERLTEICLYLDLNYCQKTQNLALNKRLNRLIFSTIVQRVNTLKYIAKGAFQMRFGNQQEFNNTLQLLGKIDEKEEFMQKHLIPHYIPLVKQHYKQQAQQQFKAKTLLQYLEWCKTKLEFQQKYVSEDLSKKKKKSEAVEAVVLAVYQVIVGAYKSKIYESDQKQLFQNLSLPILQLFKFGKGKQVQSHIQWFMQALQKRLNKIPIQNNQIFIFSFCELYEQVANLLKNTQSKFEINYRSIFTFEQWINNQKYNIPLRLNILIDEFLSDSSKTHFEIFIKKVILVFKLVKEKNLFENMYRRTLINRLVYNYATYQLAQENALIEAMEKECGEQWTLKIKQICSIFAKDRDNLFRNLAVKEVNSESNWNMCGLVPLIITENAWPFEQRSSKTVLHQKLMHFTPNFQKSYLQQGKKHKLLWSNQAGSVTLSIKFSKTSRTFIVSVDMANLLLYIQSKPKKIGNFVCEQGYSLDQIQSTVQTLSKHSIITSKPIGNDFELALPDDYAQGGVIDLIREKKDRTVEVKAMEELKPDRKLMVQAILVKLMKGEKVCKRNELLERSAPLVNQRGFNFNADFVQKSIDRLIDKQFIRDFGDGSLGYIA